MILKTPHFLVVALFLLTSAAPAPALFITNNPVADAFVTTGPSDSLVDNNYGSAGGLSVAASGLAKGEFQSVMRFDLSAAKSAFDALYGTGQWSLESVTLKLTAAAPNNPIFNSSSAGSFGIDWMLNDTWAEGTGNPNGATQDGITYTTLQDTYLSGADQSLGTFSFGGGTSGANTYTLGLPSSFTSDLMAGNLVSLRLYAADSSVSYLFNSRSFGTAAARPELTVGAAAVPEPSTIGLVALSLGLLGGVRWWQRSKRRAS